MIKTYDDLKAAVESWLKRENLLTEVPNFIQLAESHFNRTIRATEMEARATVSADNEFVALPDDFLAMREIHVESTNGNEGRDRPLKYVTPQELSHIEYKGYGGVPFAYTIADNQIKLFPAPSADDELQIEVIYLQQIPSLSDQNQTNWLLEKHPDIYLHGSLFQAEGFFYNDQRMPIWERKCDLAIAALNEISNKSRLGAGPMMPRVRSVI